MKEITVRMKKRFIPRELRLMVIELSGNRCAFSGCNANLVTTDGRLIGELASIIPYHLNGPRANKEINEEEYFSPSNFLYLCPNHHRQIDLEPDTYSVEYLRQIKSKHEQSVAGILVTKVKDKIQIPEGLSIAELIDFWNNNQENDNEEFWQKLFTEHPQIISTIYPNPIVKIGEKTFFGGKGLDNKGGNIGDFVFKNKLESVVVVEIKTPKTNLLTSKYRQNSYSISKELSGSFIQALTYKMELNRNFHQLRYDSAQEFEVIEPKCVIIAGNTAELLDEKHKKQSFELFRNSLNNTFIYTFDEIFEKLQSILDLT